MDNTFEEQVIQKSDQSVRTENENENNNEEDMEIKSSPKLQSNRRRPLTRMQQLRQLLTDLPELPSLTQDTVTQSLKSSECTLIRLAKEFIDSLNWPKALFDETHDRCFCSNCYPPNWENVVLAGGSHYVIPRGWTRLGLHVDPILKDEHDIWNKWIVTFHGTTKVAARSILTHRHFYLPGDKLIDGTILGIREGHIPNQRFIFTSPTIAYSSLTVYSSNNLFYSYADRTHFEVQMVLQCRQQPGSFKIQGETVGAESIRLCPFIPNEKIEYFTDIRSSIAAYGLLLRMREKARDT